jgi:hypothetical protein
MDDVVIYYNSKLNKYIARKKVKPSLLRITRLIQEMHSFGAGIAVSEGYIRDCREYIKPTTGSFAVRAER